MTNHYHLAMETPEANLVEGMRWLQGTFGNRFNACRKERGHVFQARYKSLVIEEGRPLLGLVNYIHLNPVRAGMVSLENLKDYGSSSYPKFFKKRLPKYLDRERFLGALEFPNSGKGMKQYAKHLEFSEEADPKERENLGKRYCRGWAVASKEYRKELKKMYAGLEEPAGWGGPEVIELREEKWQGVLEELLKEADKKREDVELSPKTAEWKVRIAKRLRETTTARNAWIAENLAMGHSSRVTNAIRGYSILWDPFEAFAVHNAGKGSAYVRAHRPAKLIAFSETGSRSSASKLEYSVKALSRPKKIALAKKWKAGQPKTSSS